MNRKHYKKHYFIYCITNTINNKKYVGFHCTNDVNDGYLGSGILIKKKIKEYGKKNFNRKILECCDENNWQEKEKFWIKELNSKAPCGYNISGGGDGGYLGEFISSKCSMHRKGIKLSEEIKTKISNAEKGKIVPIEVREKMRNSHVGKKHAKETIEKIRNSNKNKKRTQETKTKISEALKGHSYNKGIKKSKEHIEKISSQKKGKKLTPEHKDKISKTLKGKKRTKYSKRNKILCKYCGRNIDSTNYKKYHGDNCKFNVR